MGTRGRYSRNIRNYKIITPDAPCSFKGYHCSLSRLDGYEFCMRHILEDKSAPYRQCCYIYPNTNKLCIRAAPVRDRKEVFCKEHSRMIFQMRQKASSLKQKEPETLETVVNQLSHHYIAPHSGINSAIPDPSSVPSVAATELEYVDYDMGESAFFNDLDAKLMSRLEDESEMEYGDPDPLEHSAIFTTEEAARIYLEKLKKLKSLYMGEFKNLHHIMKENRREYLQALKLEKETMTSIHAQPKDTPEEREAYEELKFLSRYHKYRGKDAILHKQQLDKKLQLSDAGQKTSCFVKCIYSEGSWRCGERSVPMAKHCYKHILQDSNQVLFQKCGESTGGEECVVPVVALPHTPRCIYHTPMPNIAKITRSNSSLPSTKNQTEVVNLSDSSVLIVPEYPPDNVMEGDSISHGENHVSTRSTNKRK